MRIDIGAFEQQTEFPSLVVTTAMDVVDDADFVTSLREAINFANTQAGPDTITFDSTVFIGGVDSVIRLGGTELEITESLTIDGSTGTDVVISGDAEGNDTLVTGTYITDVEASDDAGQLRDNRARVLNFSSRNGDLTLNRLTITGGRTTQISGIGISNDGAGIRFSGDGVLALVQSSVSGNRTGPGGDGAGIDTLRGPVTLTDSTVSGNYSRSNGGGISTSFGTVTLMGSTISGNRARSSGGAIYSHTAAVSLTNSTVSGNQAGRDGGGIEVTYSALMLNNSTVANNSSGGNGGGIYGATGIFGEDEPITIQNSIIANNTASGVAPDLKPAPESALDIDFSLIGDATGSGVSASTGIGNTLNVDPLLGPLADNGDRP